MIKPTQRFEYVDLINYALTTIEEDDSSEPIEASRRRLKCVEGQQWHVVMKEEIELWRKNHTWKLVDMLRNHNVVGYKWVWVFKKRER